MAIATNGGFAASADLPLMGEPEQFAKLRLVETVARTYWGNEIWPAHEILARGKLLTGYCPDPAVTAPLPPCGETDDRPDE